MIALSQSLTRGQHAQSIPHLLIRCVLSYTGQSTLTYTPTRIKTLTHTEQVFSQKANVLLEDSDKVLHGLDLEGYKAVLSYGLITRAGEEWVERAPMWVVGQQRDSYRERLECGLTLEGIFNRMGRQKAVSVLTLESTSILTVKDLITALCDGTITDGTNTPYSNYPAYTVTYDTGYDSDGIIDVFIPADTFRISLNESRLSILRRLLGWTQAVAKIGQDEAVHILTPTRSGTTYDNIYNLVYGRDNHNFFNKRFRRRVVSPNKLTFKSHPSHSDTWIGIATDASASLDESGGGNGGMLEEETHYVRATSDEQCIALAEALLSKYQMAAEKGAGVLPFVHFGQETYDYVNFVDARAGDERAGNVGNLSFVYNPPGQFNMTLGFGRAPTGAPGLQGYGAETGRRMEVGGPGWADFVDQLQRALWDLENDKVGWDELSDIFNSWSQRALFHYLTVSEQLDVKEDALIKDADITGTLKIPSEAA